MIRRLIFAAALALSWLSFSGASQAQVAPGNGLPIFTVQIPSSREYLDRLSAANSVVSAQTKKFWIKYSDSKYELGRRGAGDNIVLDGKIRDEPVLSWWESLFADAGDGGGGAQTCSTTPIVVEGYWQPYKVMVDGVQGDSGWDFIITGFSGGETVCH